jgi:RNA polymerase sigma-54 factor
MRLEQTPRPDHVLKVSTKLITSSTILHLSADELEQTVNQEQSENPALEVTEQRVCLFCGSPLNEQVCSTCGLFSYQTLSQTEPLHHERDLPRSYGDDYSQDYTQEYSQDYLRQAFYDIDSLDGDTDDVDDPLLHISTSTSLWETLLQQLEALIPPEDACIAEHLVGNLNERGYLEVTPEEIASYLHTSPARVEAILAQLQTLEPLGIGARNPKECLLIQLRAQCETNPPPPLTHVLIETYLEYLGRNQLHEIARQLKVSEREVRETWHYIRTTLHPYPAYTYRTETPGFTSTAEVTYIHPDVIIRRGETGFEVELIEEERYNIKVAGQPYPHPHSSITEKLPSYSEHLPYTYSQKERAKFFIECIRRRWTTLKRVIEMVVSRQSAFLEMGLPRYLQPLTRAEIAAQLHLDEGTVSRTIANKYVLLPNSRLMPLANFFDSSLGIKDMLRELIQAENPQHRLSDEELARLLTAHGISLARRTITKYREEMGIGSSRDRHQANYSP